MLRFVLLLALCCVLSCSKEPPPTAPAGKATDDDCALCDFFGFFGNYIPNTTNRRKEPSCLIQK